MPTFRLVLEYDGTDFEGWQRQDPAHRSVQGEVEKALARVTGERVGVVGAGRTDAGVHAEGQVASVRVDTELDAERLARALNAVLPADVAVVSARPEADTFHARRDARSKLYRYQIWNGAHRSPLRERRWAWVRAPLDVEAMRRAAAHLAGRHDFASFQSRGSSPRTTERTLFAVDLGGEAGGELWLRVEGDGFLRHMVRNLAGTLIEVGRGRRPPEAMPAVLAARDRRAAGPRAAAAGLTLVRVRYAHEAEMP